MWQRHDAQRERLVRTLNNRRVEPEIAAENKGHSGGSTIFKPCHPAGEFFACPFPPTFVESYRSPPRFSNSLEDFGLPAQHPDRVLVPAAGYGFQGTIIRRPPAVDPSTVVLDLIFEWAGRRSAKPPHADLH